MMELIISLGNKLLNNVVLLYIKSWSTFYVINYDLLCLVT